MRRELLLAVSLTIPACFVGGPDDIDETDTGSEGAETSPDQQPGCMGCPCDAATACDPGLECAEVCLPPGMVHVRAGPFVRGCDEEPCELDESPRAFLELSGFAIDRIEVTVADYLECVTAKAEPCSLPDQPWDGDSSPFNFGAPGRDDHPINGVTWDQAAHYCNRLGKRLPTEAEWEKAARGSLGQRYPWGSSAPTCERANLAIGGPGCGVGSTIPTGQLAGGVSPVGAFDMAGNVAEWVSDYYDPDYYASAPHEDPPGPSSGDAHGVRGGGWQSPISAARSSDRAFAMEASSQIGFRCARSIP